MQIALMVQRDKAKEMNRARIRAAAELIIREEGIDRLTMRHLAERAEVSLRTPYNLFGSKTDVLIALIDGAQFDLIQKVPSLEGGTGLGALFAALDRARDFFVTDEEYYRSIYGAIMASEHADVRIEAVARVTAIGELLVAQARAQGELEGGTDLGALGRHLAIHLTAVLGMWGSGFFSIRYSLAHVRRGWASVLLPHSAASAQAMLKAELGKREDEVTQ